MRKNKGLYKAQRGVPRGAGASVGRRLARALRLQEEAVKHEEKLKRKSPHHVRKAVKALHKLSVECQSKVVVATHELTEAFKKFEKETGHKFNRGNRRGRRVVQRLKGFLVFTKPDKWV